MKKLLAIFMLLALFISCSDDDNTDPDNGNGNGKDMIDEKIIGKWKVEYSKMIYEFNPPNPNSNLNCTYYKIFEYNGDYDGTRETMPQAGLFDRSEIRLEFDKEGNMKLTYVAYKDPHFGITEERTGTVKYKTRNDSVFISSESGAVLPLPSTKYSFNEKGELVLGITSKIPDHIWECTAEYLPQKENYLYSKYSKITE